MKTTKNTSKSTRLKPENLYDFKYLGNINVIGGRILFEVAEPNAEGNDYTTGIYQLIDKRAVRFTRGHKDSGMVFDRSRNYMAYQSKEGEGTALYMRDMSTSGEYRVAEIDGSIVRKEWDTNSDGVYLIVEREKKGVDFEIMENIPLFADGKGFLQGLSYELLHVDRSGKSTSILKGKEEIIDLAINPVKGEIALEIRPLDSDEFHTRIGILSLRSGSISYLKSPDGEYYSPLGIGGPSMGYLDDGTLAFFLNKHERSIDEAPELVFWKNGSLNEVMKDHDLSPGSSLSMDSWMIRARMMRVKGKYVYFVATVRGRAGVYRVDSHGELSPVVVGDFSIDSFDFDGDEILFVAQNSNTPSEIYRLNGKVNPVFSINEEVKKWKLRKPENFHFKASDGVEIEAWFLKGRGKGTVVRIHGGPRGAFGESFIFEAHLLNSMGFSVIYCNPRGSDSYGDEFAAEVLKKYGERDYEDIMELVKYSIKKFGLDPKKMGVTGGSYGGFMVNWIVGHTDAFKAGVSDRSFGEAISDYFSGDIGPTFDEDQIGGTPYDNLDTYWEKSPIKHIRNCRTPLLLIQNDADYRCPVWQAYGLFTQLKLQGSVTKLVVFKGESHDMPLLGKPKNRVKRLEELSGWFEKFLA